MDMLNQAGFNTAEAMGRLGNNQKLYMSILSRFLEQYRAVPAQIEAMVQSGKAEDVGLQAHTIKGLAGSIGHAGLQAASLALEQAAKQNPAGMKDALPDFVDKLNTVIAALEKALPAA